MKLLPYEDHDCDAEVTGGGVCGFVLWVRRIDRHRSKYWTVQHVTKTKQMMANFIENSGLVVYWYVQ